MDFRITYVFQGPDDEAEAERRAQALLDDSTLAARALGAVVSRYTRGRYELVVSLDAYDAASAVTTAAILGCPPARRDPLVALSVEPND